MKKILTLVACLSLVATLAVGGSIAYLQDQEEHVNVMTLGNVDIEQYDENADGTAFTPNQALYPAYINPNNNSEMTGAIDKVVSVKNVGNSDAYIRTVFAFEAGELEYGEFRKMIHPVFDQSVVEDTNLTWIKENPITIGGVNYYVACVDFSKGDVAMTTDQVGNSLKKVYMDPDATNKIVQQFGSTYDIAVVSQAIQTTNMPNAEAAWVASFGAFNAENAAKWFKGVSIPTTTVATAEELVAALAAGESVVLTKDVTLEDDVVLTFNADQNVTIDLGGNTLSGKSTSSTSSKLINVAAGSNLTLKNGTVSFYASTPDTNWGGQGQPAFPGYANNTISCVGTLVIDGATIENLTAPGGASYAIDCYQGSDVTINSGRIDGHGKTAIRMFCNSNTLSTNLTINGGTVTGSRAVWVQLPRGAADRNGNANVAPVNLTVNGGTLCSTTTATESGYKAIHAYSFGESFDKTVINLNGGTYYGNLVVGDGEGNFTGTEKITINKENCTFYGDLISKNNKHDFGGAKTANGFVDDQSDLNTALNSGEKDITVAPGIYTFSNSAITADTVIKCAEGTVFTGKSGLDINGATVIGATFSNPNGTAVSGTIDGTFKDCTFEGSEALRWCYGGDNMVFENCVIKTDFRGFHFDDLNGKNVTFKNCTIAGFNAYGGEGTVTFEKCTFVNDNSAYNGLNTYSNTVLKDCTFNYVSGKKNFIDMEGTGRTLTVTNCTATLDGAAANITGFIGGSKIAENTVIVDGATIKK